MSEYAALRLLLESNAQLSGKVRDSVTDKLGEVVRATYLVLYGAGPDELDDGRWSTVPRPDSDALYVFPVKAVSTDAEGVRLLMNLVKGFVGSRPVVAGRRCDPITVDFEAASVDNTVSPPMHYMDMHIEFWSRRA